MSQLIGLVDRVGPDGVGSVSVRLVNSNPPCMEARFPSLRLFHMVVGVQVWQVMAGLRFVLSDLDVMDKVLYMTQ